MNLIDKKCLVISVLVLCFNMALKSQNIHVGGTIDTDTTWGPDTVKLVSDVTVSPGVLLSVSPGTCVEAMGHFQINVHGRIRAIGTPADSIVFTANDTLGFSIDSTSSAGGWGGFNFSGSSNSTDTSVFQYCKLQFGKKYNIYSGDIKGGLLYADGQAGLIVTHCLVIKNMVLSDDIGNNGPDGGAFYCKNVKYILIDSNSFIKNRSIWTGGAISVYNCSSVSITHNLFMRNKAIIVQHLPGLIIVGGSGSCIYTFQTGNMNPIIIIAYNKCFNNESADGAIETCDFNARIFNNLICNGFGPGITDQQPVSYSLIYNNTIANNWTYDGAIYLYSYARVYNNICWGNKDQFASPVSQIVKDPNFGNPTLFYNCVQYGNGGDSAIYLDPSFVNPTDGFGPAYDGSLADWSLMFYSSSINRGTPDTTGLFIPASDITGQPRIFGNRIDLGAYENQVVVGITDDRSSVNKSLDIFPNPTSGKFFVSLDKSYREINLDIFSPDGHKVFNDHFNSVSGRILLNLHGLRSGIYILQITTEDDILTGKIILVNN
jgi:hypothetical protein